MMRICPKCGAYYADGSSGFCLADGMPLVNVDPGSDKWSEGSRIVEEKQTALRKQKRKLKWRRVAMTATTMLVATVVVCVVAVNGVIYLKPEWLPTPSPSPSPSPDTKSHATPTPVYKISGQVTNNGKPLNGVNITLEGTKAASTATDQNGNYRFIGLPAGGSYTITPYKAKTDFTPSNLTISKLTKDEPANFSALVKPSVYQISGRVTDQRGPIGGVKITLEGSKLTSMTTDANGSYRFSDLLAGGRYTITPYRAKTDFTPSNLTVSKLTEDERADFVTSIGPPPECTNADTSRERKTIIDTFGAGWRKTIEAERNKIIAGVKDAEATLDPLEYPPSLFKGCSDALVTVTYVWHIKTNTPGVPAKVADVQKKKQFLCHKAFGRWSCPEIGFSRRALHFSK